MVPRHRALELHRNHTVDSSELKARFLVNGSPLGAIVVGPTHGITICLRLSLQ